MRVGFINTNNLPPMGYQVFESKTGWSSTPYTGLEATVTEVQRHREANKGRFPDWPLDRGSIEQFVLQYTEARLRSMRGGEQWLSAGPAESPPANFLPRRLPRQRSPDAAATGAKKPMAGVGTIISWLGDGLKPVDQATADHRASVCARCVLNVRMEGFEKAIGTVGDILHSIMEAKNHMKLATPHDNVLHQCSACLCVLKTKVFVPVDHIKKGMTPEIEAKLAPACWIRPILST